MTKKNIIFINTIIFGFIFFLLTWGLGGNTTNHFTSWFQYKKNVQSNDNSLNWVNHNYGKNFLMGIEPNSIFMTEGGDNQVFSILYFALIENKRPDVDFFDQKGNVFPRLYGDLLNTFRDELELIQAIRDFQLYSTDRPVYVTWKRKDLEKLSINYLQQKKKELLNKVKNPQRKIALDRKYQLNNLEALKRTTRNYIDKSIYDFKLRSGGYLYQQDFKYLGPWYLKQFGLAYKVVPIRYAIVEALDIHGGQGNYQQLQETIKKISKVSMSENLFVISLRKLVEEKYIAFSENNGNSLRLLKKFNSVFPGITALDYWDRYKFFYKKVYNSSSWDFLTLEIYSYYARYQREQYLSASNYLKQKADFTSTPKNKNNFLKLANDYREKSLTVTEENIAFTPNNVILNYFLATANQETNPKKAAKHFAKINEINYKNTASILRAAQLLYNFASKNQDENYLTNLEQGKRYLQKLLNSKLTFYRSRNKTGYENDQEVIQAKQLMASFNQLIANADKVKINAKNSQGKGQDLIANANNDEKELRSLIKALNENGEFTQAEKAYEKLLDLINKQNKPEIKNETIKQYVLFLRKQNIDKGIEVLEDLIKKKEYSTQLPLEEIVFFLARMYFHKVEKAKAHPQAFDWYQKSRSYFMDFLSLVNNQTKSDAETKNRKVISEKSISHIDLILSKK